MVHIADKSPTTGLDAAVVAEYVRGQIAAELQLKAGAVADDAVLKQLPGADSVRLLRIVATIERHYDLEFADEDIFAVRTFKELVALVLGQSERGA